MTRPDCDQASRFMKTTKYILTLVYGIFLIFGSVNHFIKPEMYYPFIPDFMPQQMINFMAGMIEVVLGLGVFILRFRHLAATGILLLMLIFLPLHLWDVFRENPAIGNHTAALVRLPVQFLLIGWAWFISRK